MSAPTHRTVEGIKQDWHDMIESGELSLGEPCNPHTLTRYTIKEGALHKEESVVYGRKISLQSLREKLLHKHEPYVHLHTDEDISHMNKADLLQIFEARKLRLPEAISEEALKAELMKHERTRTIGLWHDHSTILGQGYILVTAKVFYKWRLIVDMSSPEGRSINDGIPPELTSLSYISIQDVIRQIIKLGPGTFLAKLDIKSAYHIIPVHPADHHLLGLAWEGKLYVDATLPFGLRSAPKIFNAVADALQWILESHGIPLILHYLDDFITLGPPGSDQCAINCHITSTICELLGVPLAQEKCEGPCTCLHYLGFELDTVKMEVRLPKVKLDHLLHLLSQWKNRKVCTKQDLDSLIGQLQHASAVVKPGHSFLRRMIILSKSKHAAAHPLRLNKDFRADLAWWTLFISQWNGITLMSALGLENPSHTITSDASGSWGCEGFYSTHWFQLQWNSIAMSKSIAVKEFIPIILACLLWGNQWKGSYVQCQCDNEAVVAIIQSRYSRDDDLMHLLRCLFFIEASSGFNLIAQHIPGSNNTLADNLSRNLLPSFLSKAPQMDPSPMHIPIEATNLLLTHQSDWLSKTWISMFNSTLNRV